MKSQKKDRRGQEAGAKQFTAFDFPVNHVKAARSVPGRNTFTAKSDIRNQKRRRRDKKETGSQTVAPNGQAAQPCGPQGGFSK